VTRKLGPQQRALGLAGIHMHVTIYKLSVSMADRFVLEAVVLVEELVTAVFIGGDGQRVTSAWSSTPRRTLIVEESAVVAGIV